MDKIKQYIPRNVYLSRCLKMVYFAPFERGLWACVCSNFELKNHHCYSINLDAIPWKSIISIGLYNLCINEKVLNGQKTSLIPYKYWQRIENC